MKQNWAQAVSFLKIFITGFQINKVSIDSNLIKNSKFDRAYLQIGIAHDRLDAKNEVLKSLSTLIENAPKECEQLPPH